jgi:hypothetical protein
MTYAHKRARGSNHEPASTEEKLAAEVGLAA